MRRSLSLAHFTSRVNKSARPPAGVGGRCGKRAAHISVSLQFAPKSHQAPHIETVDLCPQREKEAEKIANETFSTPSIARTSNWTVHTSWSSPKHRDWTFWGEWSSCVAQSQIFAALSRIVPPLHRRPHGRRSPFVAEHRWLQARRHQALHCHP